MAAAVPKKKPKRGPPREVIVQAAIRCFVKNGIGATRAVDIAREAQISPPLFAHHYPDIHKLYADAIAEVLEGLRGSTIAAVAAGGDSPIQAMKNYIGAPFVWARGNRDLFSLWMCFYYMATFSESFEKLNRQVRETGRDRISLMIYRGIERGVYRLAEGTTVPEAAWTIQGLITGGVILAGTEGRVHDDWPENERHTCEACLRILGVADDTPTDLPLLR